jgi:hypothetical protein
MKFLNTYKATIGSDFLVKETMIDETRVAMQVRTRCTAVYVCSLPLLCSDLGHGGARKVQEPWHGILPWGRLLRSCF